MRYIHRFAAAVMFFILLFERDEGKSVKDYNLTVGPLENESGRYIYNASIGGLVHCRYCELKALRDSTYSFLQQPMCIKKYDGQKIEDAVLPEERINMSYPLCGSGVVPGCGPPPDVNKTKNHVWQCDPGVSLVMHSVYYSCALVCNITDKVEWEYYCNETLQWHAERSVPWQPCEVPVTIKPETPVKFIAAGVGGFVIIIIIIIVSCLIYRCYQKRKRARSNENVNDPAVENPNNFQLAEKRNNNRRVQDSQIGEGEQEDEKDLLVERVPDESLHSHTSGSHGSSLTTSIGTGTSERQLLLPAVGSHFRDAASGTNEETPETERLLPFNRDIAIDIEGCLPHEETESDELDEFGATGGQLPQNVAKQSTVQESNSGIQPEVKPSISVILTEDGERKQSIPLQGDLYSISKGSDFAVVPNSTGGFTVVRFKIERKDEGKPFRGEKLNFWYIVQEASEDDAGLFTWNMRLENNVDHTGCFEIGISFPPLPDVRVGPEGQENSDRIQSVRNPRNPLPVHVQQPSSTPHLKPDSLFSYKVRNNININNSNIAVNHLQLQPQCRGENLPVKVHNADPLHNAPTLINSSLFGSGQRGRSVDSGLQSEQSHRSGGSRHSASGRMGGQSQSDSAGIRAEDPRSGTSGFVSQDSREKALEIFDARIGGVSNLNIASFESRNSNHSHLSSNGHSQNALPRDSSDIPLRIPESSAKNLSDIPEGTGREAEQNSRPDPAGDASIEPHVERHRDDSLDDDSPDNQTRRKEDYRDRDVDNLDDNNPDGQTRRKQDYRDRVIPEMQRQSPEADDDDDNDDDSLSDKLDSIALQEDADPDNLLPKYAVYDWESSTETNENADPRGETDETELEKDCENRVADTSEREDDSNR